MDKFLSRKFILAVLSSISGICISLSQLDGKVGLICAIASAIIPVVTYIITEGHIDAKAVKAGIEAANEIINEIIDEMENTEEEEIQNELQSV